MGDTTDELLDLAHEVSPLPPARELDMLLTAGERISMAVLAMAISDLGFSARSFTGSQAGVITDSVHGKAKIIDVTPGRIESAIAEGHIVIVAGFQGVSQDTKEITTLGRGGTDTTAVALAAALKADVCEIYTDVDGVFTADPRIVPAARKLAHVTYEEMLELAACGAKILHLRCVEYARRYDIPIHVRSSFSQLDGTVVSGSIDDEKHQEDTMEAAIIAGVAHDRSEAKITVVGVPDKVGEAARIFTALAAAQINLDMIVQNVSAAATNLTDISFTLPRTDGQTAMTALAALQPEIGYESLLYDDKIGKVSLIGAGHALPPGRHRQVLRRDRRGRRQHRHDLHLRDPDLGRRRRGRRRRRRGRHPHRLRPRRHRGRGRRLRRVGPMTRIGIVGATGQVGVAMRQILEERAFPAERGALLRLRPLGGLGAAVRGPARSSWRTPLPPTRPGLDIALFSAGASTSRALAPAFAERGVIVVDNSSAFRMDPDVPLVVSEVNPEAVREARKGIIANPNCTTMAAMPVLKPLHDAAGLVRLVAATYQAVSGSGVAGVEELEEQVAAAGDKARELAYDGAGRGLPGAAEVRAHHRLQRAAAGGLDRRRRLRRDRRGAEAAQRVAQDPRHPRPAGLRALRAGAGLHRSLAGDQRRVRAADERRAGPRAAGRRARRRAQRRADPAPGGRAATRPTSAGSDSDPGVDGGRGLALFVSNDNLRKGAALNTVQIAELLLDR